METGQSDEVGTLGEETVGPIELPRPEGSTWVYLLLILLTTFVAIGMAEQAKVLARNLSWSRPYAQSLADASYALSWLAFWGAVYLWCNRSNPRLEITRSQVQTSAATATRIKIWTAKTNPERAFYLGACLLLGALMIWGILSSSTLSSRFAGAVCFLALVIYAGLRLPALWHPILALDEEGALVNGRSLRWSSVARVELEHRLGVVGDFNAVRLTFFNAQHQRMARVSLPKEKCNIVKEVKILEFIAARLGRRYEPLAQPDINWL